MSEICEHDTLKAICAVCHRIKVITNLTDENAALRARVAELEQAVAEANAKPEPQEAE